MAFDLLGKASTTVANTTTETTLLPATLTLPANEVQIGFLLRFTLRGVYGTTGSPTLRVRVKVGGALTGDTGTVVPPGAAGTWNLNFEQVFTTAGAAAAYQAGGVLLMSPAGSGIGTCSIVPVLWTVTSVDLTSSAAVDVTATWGTANASNTIRSDVVVIESTTG